MSAFTTSRRGCALACVLLAVTSLRAAAPEVALSGPEVQKLDWNVRVLQAVDINGDKLLDVLVANNDRATIDILYQLKPGEARDAAAKSARSNRWEPVLEDAHFRRDRVTTGVTMFDLVAADLNKDGKPDLLYSGDPQELTIQFQQDDATWREVRLTEAPAPIRSPGGLRVADLNADGRNDIVMLGLKELALFYQTEAGDFASPQRFPLADENCYGLEIFDVDGDGRADIVYLSNSGRDALRVRLQNAQGQFGPEQAYSIKSPRSTLQVLSPADSKTKQVARLVFAQQRTGQLEFVNLEPAKKSKDAAPVLRPRVFTPRASGKTPASYAFGDFNGDGREDIAVSDADGAQVFVYLRQADGGFTVSERYPSFADVRSLAAGDWNGDGRTELIVASNKEQSVGVASFNAEGRLDYPQPLPGTGRPIAVAAGYLTAAKTSVVAEGSGKADTKAGAKSDAKTAPKVEAEKRELSIVVLREEKGKRWFDVVNRRSDGSSTITTKVDILGLKTDPRGLRLVDANQDGRLDVAVFTPLDSMRLYLQNEDGGFIDAATNSGFRKGLVDNLDASAVSISDLKGDGKTAMLVSTGGFTRALHVDEGGALTVLDQFNARDTTADVTASFVLPAAKGARPDVVLYDRKGEQFQRLKANKQGVYEVVDAIPVGRIDIVASEVRSDKTGGNTELFLLGKDRFWWLPLDRGDFTARSVENYTTDLPDVNYSDVIAGDLTGDGVPELVGLDPETSLIEVLARDESTKAWVSRVHFKVFETDEHFQGRKGNPPEPREAIIADVTGDGRKDLLLLVHDRVLIYPQK